MIITAPVEIVYRCHNVISSRIVISNYLKLHPEKKNKNKTKKKTLSKVFKLRLIKQGHPRSIFGNICSEDDLRSRIFGTFLVKFLACLLLLGFSNN